MRVAGLLLLALPLLFTTSCVQADQTFTLWPDGSGALVLNVAVKKQVIKMIEELAKKNGGKLPDGQPFRNPFDAMRDPGDLARDSEGIAAWVPNGASEDAEWYRGSVIGYFEDIGKVRLYSSKMTPQGPLRKVAFSAKLQRTGTGGTLTLERFVRDEIAELGERLAQEPNPEAAKAALDLIKPALQGLKVKLSLKLPGPITASDGFMTAENQTVSVGFDANLMLSVVTDPQGEDAQKLRKISLSPSSSVTWQHGDVDPVAFATFKQDMADAKAKYGGSRAAPPPGPSTGPVKPPSLGADAEQLTDDEVDRLFIEAQLKIAREQIDRNQKDKARATLEGVLKDFPKAKAAQEAKKLLEKLK